MSIGFLYPLQQVSTVVNHDDEPISLVSSNEKDEVCRVRSEYSFDKRFDISNIAYCSPCIYHNKQC